MNPAKHARNKATAQTYCIASPASLEGGSSERERFVERQTVRLGQSLAVRRAEAFPGLRESPNAVPDGSRRGHLRQQTGVLPPI